jgi:RNA polymerase sigma-70 factor (ECF subfamily)
MRRFNPLISRVVFRTARRCGNCSRPLLDDLVQDTYLKLCADDCRLLRTFQVRRPDAIYGFLKVVTANVVHDHFKAARAVKRGSGDMPVSVEFGEPESASRSSNYSQEQASTERSILLREIEDHLKKSLSTSELDRGRLIFRLYYRLGLSSSAIASLPNIGLTTKGVESYLLRLTNIVKAAIAERLVDGRDKKAKSSEGEKDLRQAESF